MRALAALLIAGLLAGCGADGAPTKPTEPGLFRKAAPVEDSLAEDASLDGETGEALLPPTS